MARDFIYNLILRQDRASFESGARALDKISNNISRMIGVARNAAVALTGLAVATAGSETKGLQTANALGITTKRLDEFKIAAKLAGVNANALVQSMAGLDKTMADYSLGKRNEGVERALGILSSQSGVSMNIENLRAMDAADRVEFIISALQRLSDKKMAASLAQDILGSTGTELLQSLDVRKMSIQTLLSKARESVLTDETSKGKAMEFSTELNETLAIMQQIGSLAGAEIGGTLSPFLKELNSFMRENKDTIVGGLKDIAGEMGKLVEAMRPFASSTFRASGEVLKSLLETTIGLVTLDPAKALGGMLQGTSAAGGALADALGISKVLMKRDIESNLKEISKTHGMVRYDQLSPILKSDISAYIGKGGSLADFSKYIIDAKTNKSVKDGIIRPDGTVTQVSPDDWVFAARHVGDLARMFMPQGAYAPAGAGVTINQTLTLSGAEFPQSARRAAYEGTAAALRQLDNAANRRMLMSGTR